jgi:hypothetical protein
MWFVVLVVYSAVNVLCEYVSWCPVHWCDVKVSFKSWEMVIEEVVQASVWMLYLDVLVVMAETEVLTTCFRVLWVLVRNVIWIACYACDNYGRLDLLVTLAVRDFGKMERFVPS